MQQMSSTGNLLDNVDLRMLVPMSQIMSTGNRYVLCKCFLHNDDKPSMAVFPNGAYCYACGRALNPLQYVQEVYKVFATSEIETLVSQCKAGNTLTPELRNPSVSLPDQQLGKLLHHQLTDEAIDYYLNRGLTIETIENNQLGWGKIHPFCPEGYTIPIYVGKTLRQVRSRIPNVTENKYRSLQNCGSWLYLSEDLQWKDCVIIAEGEFDVLILRQLGYVATTATSGVGSFRKQWTNSVEGSILYCGFDDDVAGDKGWQRLERLFQRPIRRIRWKYNDVTDAYVQESAEYIQHCVRQANERFILNGY